MTRHKFADTQSQAIREKTVTNETIACLLNHRSIRKYTSQPVEPEKLELILRAGTRAATGGNLQRSGFVPTLEAE